MAKPSDFSRLEHKIKRLSTLIEVNGLISSSLNLDQILENVMTISKQVMNADASSLMLIDEKTNELVYEVALGSVGEKLKQEFRLKMGQGIAGTVAQEGKPLLLEDAYTHPKFYRGHDEATGYRTKSMITVPLKVRERITGVAQVINRLDGKPFDTDDLELFIALCSMVAIAIENAKMHRSLMEKQRLVRDMEFARSVQESFLPQKAPEVQYYRFSAHYTPALEVGGDFYDFIHLDKNLTGIVIGDVSGKGVSAALYMAKMGSDMRTLAFTEQSPVAALTKLNDLLAERSRRGMFATLLYIELDSRSGKMVISNAGHLPPIIKKADGSLMTIAKAGGAPLGMLPGMMFRQETARLEGGDTVILYTDGIVEAMNAKEELYGYARFENLLKKSPADPDALKTAIIEDVNRFTGLSPQHDDMTLVCFGALK
ncbi:MAG TPA: GAF domain-containing SpoIIE family protein phosphatase [Nitrospirota bacterium]|nr:GAF domain-containing SpoIIE family protein phosphatase [Nitrospirota bacterium]